MDQLGIVWWSEGVQLWCFHKWQMNEQQFVITAVFLSILNLDSYWKCICRCSQLASQDNVRIHSTMYMHRVIKLRVCRCVSSCACVSLWERESAQYRVEGWDSLVGELFPGQPRFD